MANSKPPSNDTKWSCLHCENKSAKNKQTPQNKHRTSESHPELKLWQRSFKCDRNHTGTLPDKLKHLIPIDQKEHNGQLCQMQQTGPEGPVLLYYFDHNKFFTRIRRVLIL